MNLSAESSGVSIFQKVDSPQAAGNLPVEIKLASESAETWTVALSGVRFAFGE